MKITPTEEQALLAQSVIRFLADRYDNEARRACEATPQGFDRALWQDIAGLGWLGAAVGEAAGGFGGPREVAIVMEGAGRAMFAGPLSASCVALAILEAADPGNGQLEPLMAGEKIACGLTAAMGDGVTVQDENGRRRLSGRFSTAPAGASADLFVLALPDLVCVLDAAGEGMNVRGFRGMDGRRYAELRLENVRIDEGATLCEGDGAGSVCARADAILALAITAEAAGLAARLFEDTLAYAGQRQQFGQEIGRFQALQHRLADMFVAVEETRSLALAVTRAAEDGAVPGRAVSQAVVGAVDRALHVAKEAIQLHGGVGMTEDLPLGAGLRRVKVLQLMPGGAEDHRKRLTTPSR